MSDEVTSDQSWKITFPSNPFYQKEFAQEYGKNGKIYDFTKYDAFLLDTYYSPERIRLILERLEKAYDLSEEKERLLRAHISEHMVQVTDCLIRNTALEETELLLEAGFIHKDNITDVIDQVNRAGNFELLGFLMNYDRLHFQREEFDFSL